MVVSTVVWVAYIFMTGMGIEGSFTEKLSSSQFEFQLTNGAVFGFGAGIIAFFASYIGEKISNRYNKTENKRFKKNRKKQRKAELSTEKAE